MSTPTILLVGTADTKADEIQFLRHCLQQQGGLARVMDVGVLGQPPYPVSEALSDDASGAAVQPGVDTATPQHAAALMPDIRNADVATAAGTTLADLAALGDENAAMAGMALGAAALTRELHQAGAIDGVIVLGGTMGTDLALDVAASLPLGVPKLVISTVSFSHLIPPDRIAPDLAMMLWAGGLYGLNSVCQTLLQQAAGMVLGAARARLANAASRAEPARPATTQSSPPTPQQAEVVPALASRPLIGMTSLGKSCLRYMVALKPALQARGFEVAVFHTTGMGGQAFEALAAQRRFAAVFDFSLQEVSNRVHGSVVHSGDSRLESAGLAGVPQLVAPGAVDMVDVQAWVPLPPALADRPYHAHNRLIGSYLTSPDERRRTADVIAAKLARATGPTTLLLPLRGIQQWDQPGEPLHDPQGLQAFNDAMRSAMVPALAANPQLRCVELDAHINDDAFVQAALAVFDQWLADGTVSRSPAAQASATSAAA